MKFPEYKYRYLHNHIYDGCGGIAFYFNSEPSHGKTIPAGLAIFPDGTKPKVRDPFKCGSCGIEFKLGQIILEHVEENR